MIEIKCPEKMYDGILNHLASVQQQYELSSTSFYKNDLDSKLNEIEMELMKKSAFLQTLPSKQFYKKEYSHILESHYCQMQGCMAITEKDWCDYIVYATGDNKVYVERIYRDTLYWNQFLYPRICQFLKDFAPSF